VTQTLHINTGITVGVFFQLLECVVASDVWSSYKAHFRINCLCQRRCSLHENI